VARKAAGLLLSSARRWRQAKRTGKAKLADAVEGKDVFFVVLKIIIFLFLMGKKLYMQEYSLYYILFNNCLLKNIVLEAVLVPGNLLEAVAGLHEASKRWRDLHEVPETLLSV
jgi:hypothetical protein